MAYYSSSYYDADLSEYHQTPFYCSSDFILSQGSQPLAAHSTSYDYGGYNFFEHDQTPGYGASESDPFMGSTTVAYSVATSSEPNKYFAYDPALYSGNYSAAQTQFIVSYSVSEFNVPEFEEYDPTPYTGGYDITQTYGKPLPPSEEICYPRSSMDPNAVSLGDFSHESIRSPHGKDEDESEAETQDTSKMTGSADDSHSEESEENSPDDVHPSWYGRGSGDGNGTTGDQGVEYEKRVPQIPSGYGLEAMDLCESIFGYWPCLSRAKTHHDHQSVSGEGSNNDQWKGTADYLFGGSDPYGERWEIGGSYQNPKYAYERHYQEQSLYREVEYE
ncbi:hypothetical protein SLA2020_243020 [Shorea laevis]